MRLASWLTSAKRRKPRRLNEVDFVRHGRLTCSAAVASAADDAELLAWLRARIDDERVVKWRRQFFGLALPMCRLQVARASLPTIRLRQGCRQKR